MGSTGQAEGGMEVVEVEDDGGAGVSKGHIGL